MRLLGRWTLLRFGAPQTVVDESGAFTRFPIVGGLLARAPGGSITFAQVVEPAVELRATIDGFFPRLGGKPGGPPGRVRSTATCSGACTRASAAATSGG